MVSQICTLWPLRFHQEFFIFSLMQPKDPDIPSFAHFDDCCFTRSLLMQPICPDDYPPTNVGHPLIAVG